jgi:hypothetical protein
LHGRPEQPDKKPFLRSPWSIAAFWAYLVTVIGVAGVLCNHTWAYAEAGDPGAGESFWFGTMCISNILGPISAILGAGLGYTLGRLLPRSSGFASRDLPAVAGGIVGAVVVGEGIPLLFTLFSG